MGHQRLKASGKHPAANKLRLALLLGGVDMSGKPGGTLSAARSGAASVRPADGLAPKHLEDVIGRTAARDLARGTPLSFDDLA